MKLFKIFGRYKRLRNQIITEISELEKMKAELKDIQAGIGFKDQVKYCHYTVVIHEIDIKITTLKNIKLA
jgi:hypothetical protein